MWKLLHAIHMLHKPVNIRYFPNIRHIERFTLHSDAIGTKQATMIIWHNQWLRIILPKEITCIHCRIHVFKGKVHVWCKNLALYYNMPQHINLSTLWDKKVLTFVFVHIQMLVSFKSHRLADQHVITLILSKKVILNTRCTVTSLLISYHILPTYWL